ncbi:MAG: hypothetical protein JOZ97_02820 [Candidatus Eremiobacteraeota bacterium]|nr:hypothetical protein [Candidatus Eremiobacteraeota bacterium]
MLPLIFTLALDATAAPPAGTYRYDALINGKSAGSTTVTVSSAPPLTKVVEVAVSHTANGDTHTNATLLLNAALVPLSYISTYKQLQDSMAGTVAFNGRSADITSGGVNKTFQLGGTSKQFVIMDTATMSGLLMLPAQMHAWHDADTTALVPALMSEAFLNVLHDVAVQRPPSISATDVSLSFQGEAPFVEWYDPATLIVDEVDFVGQNLRIIRRR